MTVEQLANNTNVDNHKSHSFMNKIFAFIKPMSNSDVDTDSLKVRINSTGVKLDMSSLLTNERVTEQASNLLKTFK